MLAEGEKEVRVCFDVITTQDKPITTELIRRYLFEGIPRGDLPEGISEIKIVMPSGNIDIPKKVLPKFKPRIKVKLK